MIIKRDIYLNKLIDSMNNGLIKVITVFLIISGIVMILQNYNFAEYSDSTSGVGKFLYEKVYLGFTKKIFSNPNNT